MIKQLEKIRAAMLDDKVYAKLTQFASDWEREAKMRSSDLPVYADEEELLLVIQTFSDICEEAQLGVTKNEH
jgi:hypothetical protein